MANEGSTKPTYSELAKKLVDECSVYGDDPHSGFVGLDREKVTEILSKWIQADRSEYATRFMVAGGPVVMATDYEAAQLTLRSLRAELLRVRGLLQRLLDAIVALEDVKISVAQAEKLHPIMRESESALSGNCTKCGKILLTASSTIASGMIWNDAWSTYYCSCTQTSTAPLSYLEEACECGHSNREHIRLHGTGDPFKCAACTCPTFRESPDLVPQGAESADIGKLDAADKSETKGN